MAGWRYVADGGVYTVGEDELKKLLDEGRLDGATQIQEVGAERWTTVREASFGLAARPSGAGVASPIASNPPRSGTSDWYFERGGQRVGPLAAGEIVARHERGDISDATLVWTDDFGAQWKRFSDTGLGRAARPGPPPLPISYLNATYAWLFALVPVVGLLVENVARANSARDAVPTPAIYIAYAAAYIGLGALDARQVERSGRVKRSVAMKGLVWFAPAYLFQRARALGQKQWLLGAWVVAFLAALAIQDPEVLKGNVYLGVGLPTCQASASTRQVSQIFDTIPLIKTAGVTAMAVDNPRQVTSADGSRSCTAQVAMSNGNTVSVSYDITERGDQYYYQLRIQN